MHYIEFLAAELDLLPQLLNHRIHFLHLILSQSTCRLDLVDFQRDIVDLDFYVSRRSLPLDDLSEVVVASLDFFKVMAELLNWQFHIGFVLFFNAVDLKGLFRVLLLQILHEKCDIVFQVLVLIQHLPVNRVVNFQLFGEVDERFEALQLLLEGEDIVDDFYFLVLEFMNLRHILIFKVLIKSFFFLVEGLNHLLSSDKRVL